MSEEFTTNRLENLEQLKNVDFLGFFSEETLEKLARSSRIVTLEPLEVLFEEGDIADAMYIILSGEVLVYKNKKVIAIRKPSEYIGEMGLIESEPRSATIRAEIKTQLLEITEKKFQEEFAAHSESLFALLKTLSNRARTDLDVIDGMNAELILAKDNAEQLSQVLDDTTNEIYIIDPKDYRITQTNSVASSNIGYRKENIKGKGLYEFWEDHSRLEFDVYAEELISGQKIIQVFEAFQKRRDGTVYPVKIKMKLMTLRDDSALVAIVRDLTEFRQMESKMKRMAFFDALTNLPNRNMINDRIQLALAHSDRNKQKFALLFLDMDDFKTVNDTLGHSVGDELLKQVAIRLTGLLRGEDTVARIGGDEFVVLLSGLKDGNYSTALAERIIETLKPAFKIDEHEIYSSFSIGIAVYPNDGHDVETLYKNADAAMYRAKAQGKNTYYMHDPEMLSTAQKRFDLKNDLHKALEEDAFILNYQPRVDSKTGVCNSLEVLLRWNHPEKGLILPGDFIPFAEEKGLMLPIGDWVFENILKQIAAWKKEGLSSLPLAINLSNSQLMNPRVSQTLENFISKSGLLPGFVEVEISETNLVKTSAEQKKQLNEISEMGAKIALDNFSMGLSSLNTLATLPLNSLNIDRGLVNGLFTGPNNTITNAIINVGKSLNLTTTAQGVETAGQKDFLCENNCDGIQGSFIGKPLPAENLNSILKNSHLKS
ncbi:MAG: EAL domain-containing protein [Nitrospina sp.]|nr:EAL domain-containing protein [Nitrospina sp.]